MIDVERLTHCFGTHTALSDVSFHITRGQAVGLLGKNGAGKTTTLRILAGVLRPNSGKVVLDSVDSDLCPLETRKRVGYLPESAPLYPELRVQEHLLFRAAQKCIPKPLRRRQVDEALAQVNATSFRDVRCGQLSRGMRQRVGLADALLGQPPILLLDEPTSGLDPAQTLETRKLVRNLASSCTIVFSTHVLAEVEAVCDSAIVMDAGSIVATGSLSELRDSCRNAAVVVTMRSSREAAAAALARITAAQVALEVLDDGIVRATLTATDAKDADALAELATASIARADIPVREVLRQRASLEQIFAALTEREETP
ncbi:MAG TPA: ABC transporter ATP-binding protein [Polyangiaceae bacterium]